MKTKHTLKFATALLSLSTLNPQLSTCFAQGNLTPPGAPAPTMKTLDQLEPRTAISTPYYILLPGSYYLTTNVTVSSGDGINILADNVTLDLNGFTVSSSSPTPSGAGILIGGNRRQVHILNGHVRGTVTNNAGVFTGGGFAYGVTYTGVMPQDVRVGAVTVSGCQYQGIYLEISGSTVVESCTVRTIGGYGICAGHVANSVATECGSVAVWTKNAQNCRGQSLVTYGLSAQTAQNCSGATDGVDDGLNAQVALNCHGYCAGSGNGLSAASALNCYGQSVSGTGLFASAAQNCTGSSTSGIGLYANNAHNCYGYTAGGATGSRGLYAWVAANCYGAGYGTSTGLLADTTATSCIGVNYGTGTGLQTTVAIGCVGQCYSGTGLNTTIANSCFVYGAQAITYKYNMP